MPFDMPGEAVYVGSQLALVSGLKLATGDSHLCLIAVDPVAPYTMTIVHSVVVPSFDAGDIAFNPADSRVFVYDWRQKDLRFVDWTVGSVLPSFNATADLTGISHLPSELDLGRLAGESTSGVYLRWESLKWGPRSSPNNWTPTKRAHISETAGVWSATILPASTVQVAAGGWTVESPRSASYLGPLKVGGVTGSFDLRSSDGTSIQSGLSSSALAWTTLTLTQAMQPGESYYVDGGTATASQPIWPTYRAGSPVAQGGYVFRPGYLSPRLMQVGQPKFTIWAEVEYAGATVSSQRMLTFMWAKIGEPGPTTVETLPTGETVIKNPDATFGLDTEDTAIHPVLRHSIHNRSLPIAPDPNLEGTPIIFQFIAATPAGNLIASDVFGSKIIAAPSSSAALGGGGSTSSQAAQGPSAGTLLGAKQWIRACPPSTMKQQAKLTKRIRKSLARGTWQ